ncbi:MAG: MFS transporter [Pseudomonadota bacterium]
MSSAPLSFAKIRCAALIGLSEGLAAFDETSLGVVLPTLQQDFSVSAGATHWVVNVYLVVMASLVAACGRSADFVPADRLWRLGVVIFIVTSVAAGAAPGIDWLIAVRAVQGVGSALMFATGIVLIGQIFGDEERGRAFGILASLATFMLVLGPIAGGLLTEFLSWRWVFWVAVPPALLCLFGFKSPVPLKRPAGKRRSLDLPGFAALTVSIAALSVALMQGPDWGWGSPTILGLFVVAVASGLSFLRIEAKSPAPLIDLALFRNRSVAAALMTSFMAQYRRVGTSIYLALYLRDGLGLSPFLAGLALLPTLIVLPIATVLVGQIADRVGARKVILVGIAAIGAASYWIALATDLGSYWVLLPGLVLVTFFAPTMFGPPRKSMLHDLPATLHAQASGVSVTASMLGSTLAISIGSVLLTMTGASWPIFLAMGLLLTALWLVAYRWLGR